MTMLVHHKGLPKARHHSKDNLSIYCCACLAAVLVHSGMYCEGTQSANLDLADMYTAYYNT